MKPFTFSKERTKKPDVITRPSVRIPGKAPSEPPVDAMRLQGKKATAPEWRVGKALDRMGAEYAFQYPIMGGRLPGGQVIDFLVFTVPLNTPIAIQGEYWHRSARTFADELKRNLANNYFNQHAADLVFLWERNLESIDAAFAELREKVGGL